MTINSPLTRQHAPPFFTQATVISDTVDMTRVEKYFSQLVSSRVENVSHI